MTRADILSRVLAAGGALALGEALQRRRAARTLTILAYHRVLADRRDAWPFDEEVVSCTAREFEREMTFAARGWDVISFADLRATAGRKRPPLIVTFDDGYKDNHDIVLPILKRLGLKATFFVTTGYIETGILPWWDELVVLTRSGRARSVAPAGWAGQPLPLDTPRAQRAAADRLLARAKTLPDAGRRALLEDVRTECGPVALPADRSVMMTWNDIRDLARAGMEIGSHTVSHPVLAHVEQRADLTYELEESRRRLQAETGVAADCLSYPVGRLRYVSDDAVAAARAAGYVFACLYEHGVNSLAGLDPLRLRRVKAEVGDDFERFRAKVLFPRWVRY